MALALSELLVHGVCAVPPGPVQRLRLLRAQRVQEAVPLRRGGGRGQPLLRPVRLQAQRSGQSFLIHQISMIPVPEKWIRLRQMADSDRGSAVGFYWHPGPRGRA